MKVYIFRVICKVSFLILLLAACQIQKHGNEPVWTYSVEPNNWVNWVSIDGHGKTVLAGSFRFSTVTNYGIYCIDRTGKLNWKDSLPKGYDGVFWTAISKNGCYGVAGGWLSNKPFKGFVRAYDISTGKRILNDTTESRVNVVALSDSGKWLVVCDGGKGSHHSKLRLYKLGDDKSFYLSSDYDSDTLSIGTATISSNCDWIVIGGSGGFVRLFKNEDGQLQLQNTWKSPSPYVEFVSMNPQGNVIGVSLSNGTIAIFDRQNFIQSGQPNWIAQINGRGTGNKIHDCGGDNVYGIHVSYDGKKVIAASNCYPDSFGGWIDMFSNPPKIGPNGFQPVWSYKTKRPPNPGLSMDDSARVVVSADGHPLGTKGDFYLLDAESGKEIWKYQSDNMSWPINISNDGKFIVAGSDDGKIYFWKR